MALETLSAAGSPSHEQVRRAFAMTHNGFLVLNNFIASAPNKACFAAYLPAWRRARDAWAAFYGQGWSERRYPDMLKHRLELMRWRNKFLTVCGRAEADVPIYASL